MSKNNKMFLKVIKNEQTKNFIDIHDILQVISEKKNIYSERRNGGMVSLQRMGTNIFR